MAWGALISAGLSAAGSALSSAYSTVAAGAGSLLRAAVSPSGQALLKGALDLGVGVAGSVLSRSPSGVGGATRLGLGNPNAVNRAPYAAQDYYSPGINPAAYSPGRVYSTVGDFSGGGPQMALLGAPVLTAARSALGAIASRVGPLLTGATARGIAGGAAGAAAVEAFSSMGRGGVVAPRPLSRVITMDERGRPISYAYEGRPVLYSRDLAVVRRVRRVQGELNRLLPARGGRRFR